MSSSHETNENQAATTPNNPSNDDMDLAELINGSPPTVSVNGATINEIEENDTNNKSSDSSLPTDNGVAESNHHHKKKKDDNEEEEEEDEMEGLLTYKYHPPHHRQTQTRRYPPYHDPIRQQSYSQKGTWWDHISAYIALCCYYHPWVCSFVAFFVVLSTFLTLLNLLVNPMETFGDTNDMTDYSNIHSKYDLSMGKIHHWCLGGSSNDDSCLCEDPLIPTSQLDRKVWTVAYQENKQLVNYYQDELRGMELDVVFFGDSIVEEMDGRWLGIQHKELDMIRNAFDARFHSDTAPVEGVALGIAGDTSPNALWRLLNGEMPDFFNPKVWWISLGMNDLARMKCSEEVVVLGILRVVEEILEQKPDAHVVINSLLPMVTMRGDKHALIHDYQDSVAQPAQAYTSGFADKPRQDYSQPQTSELLASAASPAIEVANGGARRNLQARPEQFGAPIRDRPSIMSQASRPGPIAFDPRRIRTPEEEREAMMREEEMREKIAQRKFLRPSRDRYNPVMEGERHRMRKFKPTSGFLSKKTVPLWTSIRAINKELRKFAENEDRVEFFDATPIFSKKVDDGRSILLSSKITSRGHPTRQGYVEWEDAILKRLKTILEHIEEEHPDVIIPHEFDSIDSEDFGFPSDDGVYGDMYYNDYQDLSGPQQSYGEPSSPGFSNGFDGGALPEYGVPPPLNADGLDEPEAPENTDTPPDGDEENIVSGETIATPPDYPTESETGDAEAPIPNTDQNSGDGPIDARQP